MKLYNEDCMNALKNIKDESVDLIVTDPPYRIVGGCCSTGAYGNGKGINNPGGILNRNPERERVYVKGEDGKTYLKGTKHVSLNGILSDACVYTRQGKLFKYNDISFSTWLPEVYRVLKDGSHAYIMTNPRNLCELETEAKKVGFKWQQLIVWDKGNSVVNKYYLNSYELIVMFRKGRAKNINDMGTKNLLRIPNIIGNKKHPTEKPAELMEILINNSSNEKDVVLDPFMGAGATGVAAIKNNRDFIGIEIDERYFKIAEERLNGEDKEITQMKWSDLE